MDLRQSILGLFPKARITSGYRGPNHPLTRKNPRSYHALGSPDDPRAVDVAPIPGVTFDDYVGKLRGAGLPIAEALDEARFPKKHTTGPNWHVALGDSKPMLQPRKPQTVQRTLGSKAPGFTPSGVFDVAMSESPLGLDAINPLAMAQAQPMAMPQLPNKKGGILGSGVSLGEILVHGLNGYLAGRGNPAGVANMRMIEEARRREEEMAFDREKLNATLEERRQRAMAPRPPTQTDRYLQEVLDPNTPMPRRQLLMQILTKPMVSFGADGSQTTQYGPPAESGDDEWEYSN